MKSEELHLREAIGYLPAAQRRIFFGAMKRPEEWHKGQTRAGEPPVEIVVNAYKNVLITRPNFSIRALSFFGLLPRTRVLNKESTLIRLKIQTGDPPGMIYDISKCFAEKGISTSNVSVFALPGGDNLYKLTAEIEDLALFSELFDSLLAVPNVKKVLRRS